MTTCPINWSEYFRYEPETGKLYWSISPSRSVKSGGEAGRISDGYIRLRFKGREYFAHRVIWAILHPEDDISDGEEIDHIDHNRTNNRPENLRKVSGIDNRRNKTKDHRNTSGVTGVGWHTYHKKWQAKISVDGVRIYLGVFRNMDDAIAARKAAEEKYGFHKNHGKSS